MQNERPDFDFTLFFITTEICLAHRLTEMSLTVITVTRHKFQ